MANDRRAGRSGAATGPTEPRPLLDALRATTSRGPGPTVGRRAAKREATEIALRRAALRLVEERGYEATTTEDIAEAAGVSPRTFFNYFPTKELVMFLPQTVLPDLVQGALRARPAGEDPVASLAAAAMETFRSIALIAHADVDGLALASLRVLMREPVCRHILHERRAMAEDVAWATLLERGVSQQDLATRSAVSSVVALAFLALAMWVDVDGRDELPSILARCLLGSPDPARLAPGLVPTEGTA